MAGSKVCYDASRNILWEKSQRDLNDVLGDTRGNEISFLTGDDGIPDNRWLLNSLVNKTNGRENKLYLLD
jgi:hypothetical protein